MRFPLLLCLVFRLAAPADASGPVILSEVYYHPPASEGERTEFVELLNRGNETVDVGGWRLLGAVRFKIPDGTQLAPRARAIVCRDADVFRLQFSSFFPQILGDYSGTLGNGGDDLTLVDASGAFADAVVYDDELPWPVAADGQGASLQRICGDSRGDDPLDWSGAFLPTPGLVGGDERCPAPTAPVPPVVISEVHYHPVVGPEEHAATDDGEDEEFLELRNATELAISLEGWSLSGGVDFRFPSGASMEPGGYLVVARNPAALELKFGELPIAGAYAGRLSNDGERLALLDPLGRPVDVLRYEDDGDWPHAADGFGSSLERRSADLPTWDAANWGESRLQLGRFHRLVGEGGPGQGLFQTLILSIDGVGEAIVDDVLLEDVKAPGVNLIANGGFEAGLEGWTARGNAAGSRAAPLEGVGGSGALRLVSTSACVAGECGTGSGVSQTGISGVETGGIYRVSVQFRSLQGSLRFRAGLFRGASASVEELPTPGAPNSAASESRGVLVTRAGRHPAEPRSSDKPILSVLVRSDEPVLEASLRYTIRDAELTLPLHDDGGHHDRLAGDGVWAVEVPAQPHGTQVRFRVHVSTASGSVAFPRSQDRSAAASHESWGYYVNDLAGSATLPTYQILLDGVDPADPADVNDVLSCYALTRASFAFRGDLYPDIEMRFRGNTACVIKKRNFKLNFNRGFYFRGLRKLNLNGLWTDKAIVREPLAWDFMRGIGTPAVETQFARVHLNGHYHGLFLEVEHPDDRFLERIGLASRGNLYKAKQPSSCVNCPTPIGVDQRSPASKYRELWERENNSLGDFSDLADFVDRMHDDRTSLGGPTAGFWDVRSLPEAAIGYQISQVVLNNIDSFAKNHFLYHDFDHDRWALIGWDMDLTFGKFFTFDAVLFPDRPVGTLNDLMLSDPEVSGDLNPWFAATVNGNPLLNWYIDLFLRAGEGRYQRAYLSRLWDTIDEKYRSDVYDARLDALADSIEAEAEEDFARWGRYPSNVPGFPAELRPNIQIVKEQIALHRAFLLAYLETYHGEVAARPRVKITEIQYLPEAGEDDLEFIELVNFTEREVDISGWALDAVDFVFPAGARVTAGESFVVARSPAAFRTRYPGIGGLQVFGPYLGRLANDGEELRLFDAGPDYPRTVDYVPFDDDDPWPVCLPGHSLVLAEADATRDNDAGSNWIASETSGGSPGSRAASFLRADANRDGRLDLTDAVFVLGYLFRGQSAPPCLDAADANDDGEVNITDPVYLLLHLFQGGAPPPEPYPVRGFDGTPDTLSCPE